MSKVKHFFNKTGECLVDLLKLDQPGRGKLELQQDLIALSGGRKSAVRKYYVKKIQIFALILAGGSLLSGAGMAAWIFGHQETEMQSLGRPGYGEGDRKEVLEVQIAGEETEKSLEITVQERKYTDTEKQQLLERAQAELDQLLPGKNESLDMVRSSLYFPDSLENGSVKVSWLTIPYGIISEDGSIQSCEEETGTLVEIQGTLTIEEREMKYTAYANVFPAILTEEERLHRSIQNEVAAADARDSSRENLMLPDSVDGKKLTWRKSVSNPFPALFVLTGVFALCIYLEMDSRVQKKARDRKNQLMLDYPDLMWKMTMLLGAGLSIKGTFFRIAEEYEKEKRVVSKGKQKGRSNFRYIYEEVAVACYEMENGIPEAQAYERFGKSCQLPEYIRLGSVLSQNLKKGSKGLTLLLEREAETAMNDRRNHARKISEQAGTKLLLPMVLMLGVVLAVLMVPAFLSF